MTSTANSHPQLPPGAEPITPEQSKLIFNKQLHEHGDDNDRLPARANLRETDRRPDRPATWGRAHLIQRLRGTHFIEFVAQVPGERTPLYRVRENPWWKAHDVTPRTTRDIRVITSDIEQRESWTAQSSSRS